MIFADSTPSPQFLSQFIMAVALFLSMGGNFAAVVALNRKQKREVTFGFEPASKEEFAKHAAWDCEEHEKLSQGQKDLWSKVGGVERGQADKLDKKFEAMTKEAHEGREKLHTRINIVLGGLRRIEGRLNIKSSNDESET